MRIFIAIELPEEKKEQLASIKGELEKIKADVKWVRPDAIHLTLKFLGEISGDRLEKIKTNLRQIIPGFGSFKIEIKGMGIFPHYNKPRIIWVGVDEEKLKQLNHRIEEAMILLGFEKEKRDFIAHLTLGRLRSLKNKDKLIRKIKELSNLSLGEIKIKEISLMESHLSSQGARYTCLERVRL